MTPVTGPALETLLDEFPSLDRWYYVNHAAVSPWPRRVVDAVEGFANANHQDGPDSFPFWMANEQALRDRAARLMNAASGAEISLVPNTTEGICIVARGLDWSPGDNVVTVAGEFPTNRMAWEALAADGVECRVIDVRETEDPEAALIGAMDDRTRVLTVSAVQWTDGFRLDLPRLGAACRTAGVLFFVDAIQQFGALPIDVTTAKIDALSAGGHKWQMGPEGIGLFYCRPEWRERIDPLKRGWRMLEHPFAFESPERDVVQGGQRFEPGSPNSLGQFALNAALSLQEDWGQEWFGERILANTDQLIRGIKDIEGLRLLSREAPERRSGIVCLGLDRGHPKELARQLAKRRVVVVARTGGIRLSPHAYQGPAFISELLDLIEQCVKKL